MRTREHLLAVAERAAAPLRRDPGIAGLLLYGSLAGNPAELTPFSDVDLAVIPRGKPPGHFAEHRLADGVKLDLTIYSRATLRRVSSLDADRLAGCGWVDDLLVRSLLIGGPETVLHDPLGLLRAARRRLGGRTTWREVARVRARLITGDLERRLAAASAALARGDHPAAERGGEWVIRTAMHHLLEAADTKRLRVACEAAEARPLARELEARLNAFVAGAAAVRACRRAERRLWRAVRASVWRPVMEELARRGIPDPAAFELPGSHGLFYHGPRIHELGRVLAETEVTFRWSAFELAHGRAWKAAEQLAWFVTARSQQARCRALGRALLGRRVDLRRRIRSALSDPGFLGLSGEARRAETRTWRSRSSRRRAAATVAAARASLAALRRLTEAAPGPSRGRPWRR